MRGNRKQGSGEASEHSAASDGIRQRMPVDAKRENQQWHCLHAAGAGARSSFLAAVSTQTLDPSRATPIQSNDNR